jgi:UDP-glucuronate decarboxylase
MHDLSIGVVRIFNTYGPRMDPFDGRVVSNFIRQALIGEKITIYGDGNQTRSFCYVSDMIDGIWRLANSDLAGPVNIGNPVEYTILELAEEIRSLLGSGVDLVFEPLPVDDPKRRKPDIGLAKSELGWEPKVPLREGLRKTVDYFEDLICSNRLDHYEPVPKKFAMAGE